MGKRYRKYGNKHVWYDGIEFVSKAEGDYYLYLKQLEQNGVISNLRLQVPFEIIPAVWGERVKHLKTKDKTEKYSIQKATYYIADFVYVVTATGQQEVVDVKSDETRTDPVYRLKKKMMQAYNNITIKEIIV